MATPQQKADAFNAAMGKLLLTDRALNGKISSDFLVANFTYTKDLQADVAKVRKTDPASATTMEAFFRDPAAGKAWLNKAAPQKTPVQQSAEQAAGAVADAITPDWASGLVGALTSGNTWLRVGEVVLGIALVLVGVAKLAGPSVINATPAGRVAKAVR